MNENWQLWLFGFILGGILCGFITYKIEQDRILSLENSYQQAVVVAQNKVIQQSQQSAVINSTIGAENEKLSQAIINAYHARIAGSLRQSPTSSSLSAISKGACGTSKNTSTTRSISKLMAQVDLRNIQIREWQKWYNQQAAIYK